MKKQAAGKTHRDKPSLPPAVTAPTLPPPYNRLQSMGATESAKAYKDLAQELRRGDAEAAAAKLVEIATDESHNGPAAALHTNALMHAPLHAVNVLGFFLTEAGPHSSRLINLLDSEDEHLAEAAANLLGHIGEPALGPLTALLHSQSAEITSRWLAASGLGYMGEKWKELHPVCGRILQEALKEKKCPRSLNGFLITALMDLGERESVPLMESAFKEKRVDEEVVSLQDVHDHFAILRERMRG